MAKEEQQKLLEQQLVFHDASEEANWDAPASPTEVASEDMDRENEEPTLLPPEEPPTVIPEKEKEGSAVVPEKVAPEKVDEVMEKVAPEKEAPTAEIKAEIKTEKEDPCSKFPVEPVHSSDAASDLEATKAGPGISFLNESFVTCVFYLHFCNMCACRPLRRRPSQGGRKKWPWRKPRSGWRQRRKHGLKLPHHRSKPFLHPRELVRKLLPSVLWRMIRRPKTTRV